MDTKGQAALVKCLIGEQRQVELVADAGQQEAALGAADRHLADEELDSGRAKRSRKSAMTDEARPVDGAQNGRVPDG